jgi:phage-related protein
MADIFEVDIDISAEAKDRLKRAFTESLVSAEVERLKYAAQSPGQKVAQQAAGIAGAVGTGANAASSALGGSVGGVGALFGPEGAAIGGAIDAVTSGLSKAVSTLTGFVRAFNPGIVERYERALNDISGVIGRTLMPLMEPLINATRLFGDFLASVLPDLSELTDATQGWQDELKELLTALAGPTKQALTDVVKGLALFIKILNVVPEAIANAINEIRRRLGLPNLTSSVGASATGAQESSIEDLGKSLQLAAFGGSSSPLLNAAEKTATATEGCLDILQTIGRWFPTTGLGISGAAGRFAGQALSGT